MVRSSAVPPGEHLLLWASIEEIGIRKGRSLWGIVNPAVGGDAVEAEAAEMLLHQMVLAGGRWKDSGALPLVFTAQLLERADSESSARHI